MTTQGYLIFAIDVPRNIRAAGTLASTIKHLDQEREVAVVVESIDQVPKKYEHCFDYIVELAYGKTDYEDSNQQVESWQAFYCTPFDETLLINSYAVAVDNLEMLWHGVDDHQLLFGSPNDFRGDNLDDSSRFWVQRKNNLPFFNAELIYFKKDIKASEFFKMCDAVFRNWREVYGIYAKENRPGWFDYTLSVNIVAHMLGENYEFSVRYMEYTDFIPETIRIKDQENNSADWKESCNVWINGNQIKVNNHRQTGLFVYHDSDIIDKETHDRIRNRYKKAKKKTKA